MIQHEETSPGKPTRLRLTGDARKSKILAAARKILAETGFEGAAVAEVARHAGVVEGTVYHHFENKRELFIRVAEAWYLDVLNQQPTVPISQGTFNRLREVISKELFIIKGSPQMVRFILMELRPDPAYRSMAIFGMSRQFTSGITEVLKAGIASGELTDSVPLRVARDMIFGGIEHRTWAYLRNEGDFDADEAADSLSSIIYKGLRNENWVSENPQNEQAGEGGSVSFRLKQLEQSVADLTKALTDKGVTAD